MMRKKIASLVFIFAMILCTVPYGMFTEVSAVAMSNADALTPIVYKTGEYTTLGRLNIYASAGGSATGKRIPKDTVVKVTSVSGEFGKTSYDGKTGWINLGYAYNTENKVDINARLDMLRKKFPKGMFWNRETPDVNNSDGYTDQPCLPKHTDKRDNYFDGTCQCHGFALKLGYDLFGIHARYWQRHYEIDKVRVGDIIRYRSRHTIMVTGVYDTYFTVADCNWNCTCNIDWDRKMQKSYLSFYESNPDDGIYHCPANYGYITFSGTVTKATTTTTNATSKVTTTTKVTTKATTTTTKATTKATTTTKASANTSKYVLTTKLSVNAKSTAVLAKSEKECYFANGVIKDGVTSYTFIVPSGIYPELVIIAEGCEEYCIKNFTPGKDKLPPTITLKKNVQFSQSVPEIQITSQPSNVSVKAGKTAAFSVKAQGSGLKYQWYYKKSGTSSWCTWDGYTTASIVAQSNATWNGMQVYCKITDSTGGKMNSNAARVTIIPELKITSQPASISVKVGRNARFTVKAEGSALKYQWYYKKTGTSSWCTWDGHTTASIVAQSNATWNGMQVYCKITDGTGDKIESKTAKVTIVPELTITGQPANVSVKAGRNVSFSVKASGSGLKYQWYYKKSGASSWSVWNGHTTASFTAVSNATWNGMQVYCKVTDSTGDKLDSKAATITVIPEIIITKQPGNVSVKSGKKVTFSVKANGNGLKYQWYYRKAGAKSWSIWKGHTTSSVTATSNASWKGMNVFCEIKDASGNIVKSDVSKITIK